MIPQSYITEWSEKAQWGLNQQVEQDLIICRALVAIYSDDFLTHGDRPPVRKNKLKLLI